MSIKDRIINSPELQEARKARDLDALAAGLNAQGIKEVCSRFVTMRTITSECSDADAIINELASAAKVSVSVAEMLGFLRSDSGMDVGHPNTQEKIDALVSLGALTEPYGDEMKNLALQPVVVTRDQVEAAMFNPDGTEKA
jgi:hypothetical protein